MSLLRGAWINNLIKYLFNNHLYDKCLFILSCSIVEKGMKLKIIC